MLRFAPFLILAALLSAFVAACGGGGDDNGASSETPTEPSVDLHITAKGLKFDRKTLAAVPNTEISLTFDNDDSGVPHNVAIYKDKNAREKIWASDLISGQKVESYTFTSPAAGTYYFRCDAHPDMNGTFLVSEPTGASAGP